LLITILLIVLFGVRPVGEPGHEVELSKQATDDVIAIATAADVIQLRERLGQRRFGLDDRVLRIILTLGLKAPFVLEELLPIEIGSGDSHGRPRLGQDTH
jgi:hypothetical protein